MQIKEGLEDAKINSVRLNILLNSLDPYNKWTQKFLGALLQPKLCYWYHSYIYFCSASPSTPVCLSPEVWHLFIYKVLGILPCIAKGFHSGLRMISAIDMKEEMTLGPFAPWSLSQSFWKTPHIVCIKEIVDRAISEQLDHKDAMQQEARLLGYTQMTEQLEDTTSKLEKD